MFSISALISIQLCLEHFHHYNYIHVHVPCYVYNASTHCALFTHTHTHTHTLVQPKEPEVVDFDICCMICTNVAVDKQSDKPVSCYTCSVCICV